MKCCLAHKWLSGIALSLNNSHDVIFFLIGYPSSGSVCLQPGWFVSAFAGTPIAALISQTSCDFRKLGKKSGRLELQTLPTGRLTVRSRQVVTRSLRIINIGAESGTMFIL
jgi:hypothetical protein